MSAVELAGIVEGWATLAGLVVVSLGAVFAGQQLLRESRARRLQAVVALYADVWPMEANRVAQIVQGLPDDFDHDQLGPDEREAVHEIAHRFNRLGYLLRAGLVRDEDIFPFYPFGMGAIRHWEKLKHVVRRGGVGTPAETGRAAIPGGGASLFEYLASRAQRYVLEHGEGELSSIAIFDADVEAVAAMDQRARRARVAAG